MSYERTNRPGGGGSVAANNGGNNSGNNGGRAGPFLGLAGPGRDAAPVVIKTGHHQHHPRKLVPRTDFLRRPGWCTAGEPIRLVTNHYGIRIDCAKVFMYDVTITPMFFDKRKNEYRPINGPQERRMNKQASENNRQVICKFYESMTTPADLFFDKDNNKLIGYAYDGVKTLFTATLLRHEHEDKIYRRERVEIEVNERTKCYEVIMKYTSEVDMTALHAHRQGNLTLPRLTTADA